MTSTDAPVLSEQEIAVRAVLDGTYTAWADNDPDAFVASYAENSTALLPGMHLSGREAVRAAMTAAFAEGPLKGSSAVHEVRSVRFLTPGTAIVISDSGIVLAGASEPRTEDLAQDTWVLAEQDGAWYIEAYHSCPAPQDAA